MEQELRRVDDHRFDRIEAKLDHLEAQMLKLWQNGLSEQGRRISSLEAAHAVSQYSGARETAKKQQWITVVGWFITAANTLGIGVIMWLLNHAGKP